jgi:ribosome biogenesis GTPase
MCPSAYDALVPYGWSDRVLALFREVAAPGLRPARVVRVQRSRCLAVADDGIERPLSVGGLVAVGDWAAITTTSVGEVLTRWSALTRLDPSENVSQLLAANVDLVVITAPADRLSAARVERELALAWDSGAQPLVAVTKADLDEGSRLQALEDRLRGVDVIGISTVTGRGLDELRERLRPARTAVLLGPSGAGKSTLTNALLGTEAQAIGAVREGDSRGRHTTSSRQLVVVPGGGVLIDTPGLRSLGLAGGVELDQVFPEIDALATECRFSDCHHDTEPGCAVQAALRAGTLDPGRLTNFRKLTAEAAVEERKEDPLAHRARQQLWKRRSKDARQHDKRRPGEDG